MPHSAALWLKETLLKKNKTAASLQKKPATNSLPRKLDIKNRSLPATL